MALSKDFKLKNKKNFDLVFKRGKSVRGSLLFIKFIKNNLNHVRLGVVISSKISRKAVERNQIGRRIKEIFRTDSRYYNLSFDIIVLVTQSILSKPFEEIKRDLEQTTKQIKGQ